MCVEVSGIIRQTGPSKSLAAIRTLPALLLLGASDGFADTRETEERPDKSAYSLFHPVPSDLMRPMILDRPDKTESPYTVDAGHFQVEMDLVNGAWDRDSNDDGTVTTSGFALMPMNWKAGLVNHVDLQLVVLPYNRVRADSSDGSPPVIRSGFGDLTTRLKVNLWGDDSGSTALAVMPFVTWPTAADGLGSDGVEGGIIVPFAAALPAGWSLGMMTEVDLIRSGQAGITTAFVNTATLGHSLFGPVAGYVEFFSEVSTDRDQSWIGTLDFGVTWTLKGDWILDAGINVGVTRSAPDLNPFAGFSHRF